MVENGFDQHLIQFGLTLVFSFLIGLEVKTYRSHLKARKKYDFFGTTRTITFFGVLGYIFYLLDPTLKLYIFGVAGFTLLYALFYVQKLKEGRSAILLYLVSLLVYSFGPLLVRFPLWMATLLFVTLIFVLNAKGMIQRMSESTDTTEFETLGKIVLLSGVILPLLPHHPVSHLVPISPFAIWMAVVIISGISYAGYLLQKYIFPDRGYYLTGLIGGLYSSTATTVVLARKIAAGEARSVLEGGIVAATAMMYLRLIVVAGIFNLTIARELVVPFLLFSAIGFALSLIFLKDQQDTSGDALYVDRNPLELGTAFLFSILFVVMMVLTSYVTTHFGLHGLQVLSFVAGLSDIDPFILSLLTGKYSVTQTQILSAIMIAAGSNNVLKAVYALWFGGMKKSFRSALVVMLLGVGTIGWAFWI